MPACPGLLTAVWVYKTSFMGGFKTFLRDGINDSATLASVFGGGCLSLPLW